MLKMPQFMALPTSIHQQMLLKSLFGACNRHIHDIYNEVLSQVRPGAGCPLLHRLRGQLRLQAVAGQARHHQPQGHHIWCRHFILALMHFTVFMCRPRTSQ